MKNSTIKNKYTISNEKPIEPFTASFLLSEYRADIRRLDNKIDSNLKWMIGLFFVTTVSIITAIFLK